MILIIAVAFCLVLSLSLGGAAFLYFRNRETFVRTYNDAAPIVSMYSQEFANALLVLNNLSLVDAPLNPYDAVDAALEKTPYVRDKLVPDSARDAYLRRAFPLAHNRLDGVKIVNAITGETVTLSHIDVTFEQGTATFSFVPGYIFRDQIEPEDAQNPVPYGLLGSAQLEVRNPHGLFFPYATSLAETHLTRKDFVKT
jgi:hypothetical protein